MNFSIKDFFSKCDQICRKLRIWSHLLKKPLMKSFIFCAMVGLSCKRNLSTIMTGNVSYDQCTCGCYTPSVCFPSLLLCFLEGLLLIANVKVPFITILYQWTSEPVDQYTSIPVDWGWIDWLTFSDVSSLDCACRFYVRDFI